MSSQTTTTPTSQTIQIPDTPSSPTSSLSSLHTPTESIDSQPTSPSHSHTTDIESLEKLTLTRTESGLPSAGGVSDADSPPSPERELFQATKPTAATRDEITSFSHFATQLSLFASCLAATPMRSGIPPSPAASTTISTTPFLTSAPTSASTSTSIAVSQVDNLLEQRKAELQRDLLELISDEKGPSEDLIIRIERLMSDWEVLYERLEIWRAELKGAKVREMFGKAMK